MCVCACVCVCVCASHVTCVICADPLVGGERADGNAARSAAARRHRRRRRGASHCACVTLVASCLTFSLHVKGAVSSCAIRQWPQGQLVLKDLWVAQLLRGRARFTLEALCLFFASLCRIPRVKPLCTSRAKTVTNL